MSKVSEMLNGSKKRFVQKTTSEDEIPDAELKSAFERLEKQIEKGLTKLANDIADELENGSDGNAEVTTIKKADDNVVKKTREDRTDLVDKKYEWEVEANKAGWTTKTAPVKDMVNSPSHYKGNRFEVIDIIEDYELGFNLGNAIKYILRCNKKWNKEEDLKKAMWYIDRELNGQDNRKGL